MIDTRPPTLSLMTLAMILSVLSVLSASTPAAAVTRHVNGSCGNDAWNGLSPVCSAPNGPKATIQAAINASSNGDEVVIADGTYTNAESWITGAGTITVGGVAVCNPVDFNCDGNVDVVDVNLLTAVGDLTVGIAEVPATEKFDLIDDGTIDTLDLDKWRADAATVNGFGSAYFLGDANVDGDVDVFQFDGTGDAQILTSNLGTLSGAVWGDGDFNADGDVDVFEFGGGGDAQLLTSNLGSTSDTGVSAVPEPSTVTLFLLCLVGGLLRRRSR